MNGRLIIAVVSTLLDEAALIFLLVWGLPWLGIKLPLFVLILIGALWTVFAVVLYISATKILRKEPLAGQTDMIGFRGRVVKELSPQGMVRTSGEIWAARSISGIIRESEEIEVIGQEGLTLIVKRINKDLEGY